MAIQFPYFRGTEVANIKYRDENKNFRMAAGAERILYGLNDVSAATFWAEGECDKLAIEVAGYPNCVSVPDGAPTPQTKNYSNKFEFLGAAELDKVERHIIAVDNDPPGRRLQEELVRRLGYEKCWVVTWPDDCKDANEVLIRYGSVGLRECLDEAKPLPVLGAHDVTEFETIVKSHYENGRPRGAATGWTNVDKHYTVRPKEWTLITGIPGHGKSEWLDALTINLARSLGWGFGVYSPENLPFDEHLIKLAEKYIGKPFEAGPIERMNPTELDQALTWLDKHYTQILPEESTVDSILATARGLVLRKGIRGLIIDPWNEIDHSRPERLSETEYISQSLSKIRQFAQLNGVHVWLIAHPTKLLKDKDGNYPVPTPYDVSGSAHWRNKADNCIAVWRNTSDSQNRIVEVHVQKIRHKIVGRIGMVKLIYDHVAGRYFEFEHQGTSPIGRGKATNSKAARDPSNGELVDF